MKDGFGALLARYAPQGKQLPFLELSPPQSLSGPSNYDLGEERENQSYQLSRGDAFRPRKLGACDTRALRKDGMLIAIEGCIGAGKSTVAKGLAEYRNSNLLLERFEEHPFLKLFYENPTETATETEIAFLLLHYSQLRSLDSSSQRETVADFHLGKDLLYADLNLTDSRAKTAFLHLYEVFSEKVPPPTMFVYLSARTDLILDRIHRRNREFEAVVDPAYYARINDAYDKLFLMYSGKKLSISMEEWDFVTRPSLYQELSALIDSQLPNGK